MEKQMNPEDHYEIPKDFYEFVKPYLEADAKIKTKDELIRLWQEALNAAERYPRQREAIAETTLSIGAYSPFIDDNDIFQALHLGFGSLEVADSYVGGSSKKTNQEWKNQQKLFKTLLKEYRG